MHESDRRLSLLGFLIDDVSRLHRKTVDRALKLMGLTESQCRVLASLARDGSPLEVVKTSTRLPRIPRPGAPSNPYCG